MSGRELARRIAATASRGPGVAPPNFTAAAPGPGVAASSFLAAAPAFVVAAMGSVVAATASVAAATAWAILASSSAFAADPATAAFLTVEPRPVFVGGVAIVRVFGPRASGSFDGEPLAFFSAGEESIALVGIDLDRAPGEYALRVTAAGSPEVRTDVRVVGKDYPVERLKVARAYTDLDRKTLERVDREQRRLEVLWASPAPERLWQGSFVMPADGPAGSPFGLRRFFNGEPRSPHAGIDIRAPKGAPVRASNRGRVVLADELFFTGKTVVLDHGLGLFTLYVHLSQIETRPGAIVDKGGGIGKVGATGRVTGPHLHFAARIGTARVDPEALLGREIEGRRSVGERKGP